MYVSFRVLFLGWKGVDACFCACLGREEILTGLRRERAAGWVVYASVDKEKLRVRVSLYLRLCLQHKKVRGMPDMILCPMSACVILWDCPSSRRVAHY